MLSLSMWRTGIQDQSILSIHVACVHFHFIGFPHELVHMVLVERSFVSCSLRMWSCLILCCATAELSVC